MITYTSQLFSSESEFYAYLGEYVKLHSIGELSDLENLGMFFDAATASWEDDGEKETEAVLTADLHLKSGVKKLTFSLWGFGMSTCGETHHSASNAPAIIKGIIDAEMISASTSAMKREYAYDGSNWEKPGVDDEEVD